MQRQTKHVQVTDSLWLALLVLTSFFFLIEVSFFIACNKAYLGDFTFIADRIHIPLMVVPGLLYFIFAQVLLHFLYFLLIYWLASCLASLFQLSDHHTLLNGIFLWFLGLATVFLANQYFFPFSKFSELTRLMIPDGRINEGLLILTALLMGLFFLIAFAYRLLVWVQCIQWTDGVTLATPVRIHRFIYVFLAAVMLTFVFFWGNAQSSAQVVGATAEKPNIIIIGADSLRPNALQFFGSANQTPFFDSFLQRAVVFDSASTPLARTFPSWIALLTGEYPKVTGIRSNLVSQAHVNMTNTLPAILKRHGYETFYATDETRFSNMQKKDGFDQIITPPMGLNDFLIGTFNDFPLSNLILNTFIGKYLFPYSYGNRPAFLTYGPHSFLARLQPVLMQAHSQPVFLAVHFCLTHAPYLWDEAPMWTTPLNAYDAAVQREDQQIQAFYDMLNRYHWLNHAIVIILSDHGEALELPGDRMTAANLYVPTKRFPHMIRFYPPSEDDETVNQSAGHGTDVLSWAQYHTLLGFRFYGVPFHPSARVVSGDVSLLDIKPTILQFLRLPSPTSDGISLAETMMSEKTAVSFNRPLFLESDFSPASIRTVYPNTRQVVLDGGYLFQINPKRTRLTVKPSMLTMIIHSKQYAVIRGHWILALYPQNPAINMPILINRKTGHWTNDLQSPLATSGEAKKMLAMLQAFYGNDIQGRVLH